MINVVHDVKCAGHSKQQTSEQRTKGRVPILAQIQLSVKSTLPPIILPSYSIYVKHILEFTFNHYKPHITNTLYELNIMLSAWYLSTYEVSLFLMTSYDNVLTM